MKTNPSPPLTTASRILLAWGVIISPLAATIIGMEDFTYPNGVIAGQNGGTGWAWNNGAQDQTNNGGISSWLNNGGTAPEIDSNALVTNSGIIERQYGEDQVTGAVRGTNQFFYKVTMTRNATGESFISHSDFGTPKVHFGADSTDGLPTLTIVNTDDGNDGTSKATEAFINGQTYTLVCVVDFDNDLTALFIDPDNSDYWTSSGNNSADIVRTFTNGNWASRVRFSSTVSTTWDDLIIATSPTDVGLQSNLDADGDGLSFDWENANGLDDTDDGTIGESSLGAKDGPNGALGDPDNDGLTNRQEFDGLGIADFDGGTNPRSGDSDNDNLSDQAEIFTHNTNPSEADSDNDGINDDIELSGAFNPGFANAPTNPNLADSDLDGFSDLSEIQLNTNPNDRQSNPNNLGIIVIDGTRDPLYGDATAVQTINSGFGNNELDAAYAYISEGKLNLMITGNLENNFNKLEIFFDTGDQITTNVLTTAGNDNAGNMDGMTFDTDFSPEYHLIARRGFNGSTDLFDLDIANLVTSTSSFYGNLFNDSQTGSGTTGTSDLNNSPISIAYDDSNTAGITQGDNSGSLIDQAAALAVTTGIELSIDLADLGNPTDSLKVMVLLNNDGHNFLSNQSLAGLPETFGNLANPKNVDFSTFTGDQFFPILIGPAAELTLNLVSYDGTSMVVDVTGTQAGKTYDITSSTNLLNFTPTGQTVTSSTATGLSIPTSATTFPARFFRVEEQTP